MTNARREPVRSLADRDLSGYRQGLTQEDVFASRYRLRS
jgi:hypothetical protein